MKLMEFGSTAQKQTKEGSFRMTIPKQIAKSMELSYGDKLICYMEKGNMVVKRAKD